MAQPPSGAVVESQTGGFSVSLSNFDGPFDLLLSLITKHEMDITEVSLSKVTDEFISYLRSLDSEKELDAASEFLVVAATLLDLKVAGLLPQGELVDAEDVALYKLITPHLQRAVQINLKSAQMQMNHAASRQALDRLSEGVLFVDVNGSITLANRSAENLFAAEAGLRREPGTASTSRPYAIARFAVMRAPPDAVASTTTVASLKPAMIRLRSGKRPRVGGTPGGCSPMTRPWRRTRPNSAACWRG